MKSITVALLFAATVLIATFTVTTALAADSCTGSVKGLPATCTGGTIVADAMGGCRVIKCANGGESMQVMACDKPGSTNAQYFEMYKQSQSGSSVSKICLGSTCIAGNGYAKSEGFCSTATSAPAVPTAPAPTPAPVPAEEQVCGSSVQGMPVSCTSTIVSDSWNGCRKVTCGTSGNSITALACDKGGYFEVYRQSASGTVPKVCFGTTCIQYNGFAKSAGYTCEQGAATAPTTTTPAPAAPTATTTKYPVKKDVVATIFWAGQSPSADTGWSHNYDSAWDTWWVEHYGGYDDPNNRDGWHPAAFTPKENPFYVAIPYTDFSYTGRKSDAFAVVPWSDEKSSWGYQESMIKNRWVKITKGSKTVYAQVENSGPGPTDDHQYVFGSNPQPTTDFGWKAGIDVSPAVRDYIGMSAVDKVDWQWVDAKDVPAGPWKDIVTTRQSCWASRIADCR